MNAKHKLSETRSIPRATSACSKSHSYDDASIQCEMPEISTASAAMDPGTADLRLYESLKRQVTFQCLVKRYYCQILHGCNCPSCTTSSCLSYQRRSMNGRPFRKPTAITARILAFHYASQSDPVANLCPHPLSKPLSYLQADGPQHTSPGVEVTENRRSRGMIDNKGGQERNENSASNHRVTEKQLGNSINNEHINESNESKAGKHSEVRMEAYQTSIEREKALQKFDTETKSQVHVRKDKKSLSQTLFDSLGLIGFIHFDFSQIFLSSKLSHRILSTANGHLDKNGDHETKLDNKHDDHEDQGNGLNSDKNRNSAGTGTNVSTRYEEQHPEGTDLSPVHERHAQSVGGAFEAEDVLKLRSSKSTESPARAQSLDRSQKHNTHKVSDEHSVFSFRTLLMKSSSMQACASHPMVLGKSIFQGRSKGDNLSTFYHTIRHPDNILKSIETLKSAERDQDYSSIVGESTFGKSANNLIFDCLRHAVNGLFGTPPEMGELGSGKVPNDNSSISSNGVPFGSKNANLRTKYYTDSEVAKILALCVYALSGLPSRCLEIIRQYCAFTSYGIMLPELKELSEIRDSYIQLADIYSHEPAIQLVKSICQVIAHRRCIDLIMENLESNRNGENGKTRHMTVLTSLVHHLADMEHRTPTSLVERASMQNSSSEIFLEWLRTTFLRHWDGKPVLDRWGVAGAAAEFLGEMYLYRSLLGLKDEYFHIPYLYTRLDRTQTPLTYCQMTPDPNKVHILHFGFLFKPKHLVTYFRVTSYERLYTSYTKKETNNQLPKNVFSKVFIPKLPESAQTFLPDRKSTLTLDIRREHALQDAFDQLWRRGRTELLKPLKATIKGEEGLDQGGVSIEFFRIAIAEAFNPDAGMFSTDAETRMSWFQPNSLEPIFRFELVGMLFSLAIYNGMTLPVAMPLAFYLRLLREDVGLKDITDGWPRLAQSLNILLEWEGGDVADVFTRTYEYSFDFFGEVINIDLLAKTHRHESSAEAVGVDSPPKPAALTESSNIFAHLQHAYIQDWQSSKWDVPTSNNEEPNSPIGPVMVTNENRHQYVSDYIHWLTYGSISEQFDAFSRGFYTCLNEKALSILTPNLLRGLLEGTQEVDMHSLEASCQYEDGYTRERKVIVWFWEIVHAMNPEEKRQLLEFVTASDRVPVSGVETIAFSIVRNGPDTERLPTSSTCFGKLLLPEYSSKEKLEEKLRLACNNSKGFGVV